MIHHLTRATRHLIFWTLITVAVLLTTLRLALIGVDRYKSRLEHRIEALIGSPVRVNKIGTRMRGFSPELILEGVDVDVAPSSGKPAIHLDEIRFGLDMAELVMKRDWLSSSWITLVGARLMIYRDNNGNFAVQGLDAGEGQPLWLLQGRHYQLLQSQIEFNDYYKDAEPFKLDGVNLAITNEGDHHRINLITQLPERYGDYLTAVFDFNGRPDKLSELTGKSYIEGKRITPPKNLADFFPSDLGLTSGAADFKIWSVWRQAKPVDIIGNIELHRAGFTRPGKSMLRVNELSSQFHWRSDENRWQLDVGRFLMKTSNERGLADKKWPDLVFSLVLAYPSSTRMQTLTAYAKQADLAELSHLVRFFSPSDGGTQADELFGRIKIHGIVKDFAVYAEPETESFAVNGRFDASGVESSILDSGTALPGIANLSGVLKGSETTGKIRLDSRNIALTDDRLFERPLAFSRLVGAAGWRQTGDEWLITGDNIELTSPVLDTLSRFRISIAKPDRAVFVDCQSTVHSDRLQELSGFMPAKIMKDRLKAWLGSAFFKGRIAQGQLLFYGNPTNFPFDDESGVFQADLELDGVELNFHPGWPRITDIGGRLTYDHRSINGQFHRGNIGLVDITKTEMSIPGLGGDQEQLFIKGEAKGEINEVLRVLQQSPVAGRVNAFVSGAEVKGTTEGGLDLTVPLHPGHEIKLDGFARFVNAEMTLDTLNLKVNKITGDLKYNMQGIYSDPIRAYALAHPVTVSIGQSELATEINVEGKTKVRDIENLFDWPHSDLAQGEGPYQLQLTIPKKESGNPSVSLDIQSTLEGFAIALPGTLAKTENQKKPSLISVILGNEAAMPLELNYNNELKAALSIDTQQRKVNSGHLLIGRGNPVQRRTPGIKLEIDKAQLPLHDWLALALGGDYADEAAIGLNEIRMKSESAFWRKTNLGQFDLTLKRNTEAWAGEIDSSPAKGKFEIPAQLQGSTPILLDMDMLNLSVLKQFKMPSIGLSGPAVMPVVDLQSKKTLWQSANLGRMVLKTGRMLQGIAIKELDLNGADASLVADGVWKSKGFSSSTRLKGKLDVKNSGRFFDKLNLTGDLSESQGTLDFDLNWPNEPWQLSMSELRGNVDVNFKNGRILSIEPGFGRLLGILAVEQWVRRLQLDFSDVYQEGLTFNSIKGNFFLENGKADTGNLVIDAIPATITLQGETDLGRQTVNHVIKVVPKSSDAVPIAGTIVGELAALVGKSLTGKNQEGFFFGTEYEVKGGWDDAKISSRHENDGLFQKTWNSITDFSWLEQTSGKDKK